MKPAIVALGFAAAISTLAGCATQMPVAPGMTAGKFVTFTCADGKVFSARAAEDGASVRVRALHGSAELDRRPDASYAGEGYTLTTQDCGALSLMHEGKSMGSRCKAAA